MSKFSLPRRYHSVFVAPNVARILPIWVTPQPLKSFEAASAGSSPGPGYRTTGRRHTGGSNKCQVALKKVEELGITDFEKHPVWKYVNMDEKNETMVSPIKRLPVNSLINKVIGTSVVLFNKEEVWGMLGNLDETNPKFTEHFRSLSIVRNGVWFHLARYHDVDIKKNGPNALAKFLGLTVEDVFPISYDLRNICSNGLSSILVGKIARETKRKLPRAQLMALAVPDIQLDSSVAKAWGY